MEGRAMGSVHGSLWGLLNWATEDERPHPYHHPSLTPLRPKHCAKLGKKHVRGDTKLLGHLAAAC